MQSQLASLGRSKTKLNEYSKEEIDNWSERFGQIPAFIAKKTLDNHPICLYSGSRDKDNTLLAFQG